MTKPYLISSNEQARENAQRLKTSGGNGGDRDDDMDDRVRKIETSLSKIDGQLDWAKVAATTISGVTIGGFAILITLMVFLFNRVDTLSNQTNAKIDRLGERLDEEFRAQRQELSAQTSALANAITATKKRDQEETLAKSTSGASSGEAGSSERKSR